jgi:hypothetical protein
VRFIEAAEEVLRREGRPLTTKQITELALARGLIETHGKTPEATMSAALYGASAAGPIQREFRPGRARAIRGSVRWAVAKTSPGKPARTSRTR